MPVSIRSKEDIVGEVLQVISNPVRSTHIMYKANLSYNQLKYYLQLVQEKGLAERVDGGLWFVTEKGREYLDAYRQLLFVMGENMKSEEELDISPLAKANYLLYNSKI